LEGGKIVESGTYNQLMTLKGKFADLVARQQLDQSGVKKEDKVI
jgi:ABC-type multidrug transport system fused ATPase/permease subunit